MKNDDTIAAAVEAASVISAFVPDPVVRKGYAADKFDSATRRVFLAAELSAWKVAAQCRLNEEIFNAPSDWTIIETVEARDLATLKSMAVGEYLWKGFRNDQMEVGQTASNA